MIYPNSPINPSIILGKHKYSPIMNQLARGLLIQGDMNYQQAFHRVIVASTFRLLPLKAD
jgi:hypothetical protein